MVARADYDQRSKMFMIKPVINNNLIMAKITRSVHRTMVVMGKWFFWTVAFCLNMKTL